jgi:homospermidine synthase
MLKHPRRGMVESEALDHDFVLQEARPYWEPLVCVSVHWHPATGLLAQGQVDAQQASDWCLDQFWEDAPAGDLG